MTAVIHPEATPGDGHTEVSVDQAPPPVAGVWGLAWRVAQHRPKEFWLGWFLFVVFFTMPAITGYLLARGYGALERGDSTETIWWSVAIAVSETIRMVSIHHGALIWTRVWLHMQTLLRANMLSAQMASGGIHAGQPVGSAGSAVTHFRDDTEDVANLVDGIVDISGGLVFTVVRRVRARCRRRQRRTRAGLPVGGRRTGDACARHPDQGVPGRRSCGDRAGHRPARRHHGGSHHREGQRRR